MAKNSDEMMKELMIQQAISNEASGQLKTVGTAYILFFASFCILGFVGLHRLYLGRGNILIGVLYFPLSILTIFLLPLCDLVSLSSTVDKTNKSIRDEIESRVRKQYMFTEKQTPPTGGYPVEEERSVSTTGGSKSTAIAGCIILLVIGVFIYRFSPTTSKSTLAREKKNRAVTLETKIRDMPKVCRFWVKKTVANMFGTQVSKWGKHGAWRKGRYNFASYRFIFPNNNRFKILCCIDRQTQKFGLWSITDLKRNKTTTVQGNGSCRE